MGIFDKREKMDFDKASGVMFVLSITLQDQGMMIKGNLNVSHDHLIAVNTGYVLGISLLFISSQIGLKRVNEFIRSSLDNADETLTLEMKPLIPFIKKYCENAKNFILMESFDLNSSLLFDELTELYLNDMFGDNEYSSEIYNLAKNDLLFYYRETKEFVTNIKITS